MQNTINAIGKYMVAYTTQHHSYPYVDPYQTVASGSPNAGMLRIMNGKLECWTGTTWATVNGAHQTISFTGEGENILDWAKKKMDQENEIAELAKENAALAAALASKKQAEEQLLLVYNLVRDHAA